MQAELLTTGKAARFCSVKPDTVLKWIKKGRLPAARTAGGHYRIEEQDLLPLLSKAPCAPVAASPQLPPRPLRCWEFMSRTLRDECRNCFVYRARAGWCFRMRAAGNAKVFCTGPCQECPYYRRVHGLATNVLVVTRDERFIQDLAKRSDDRVAFRFARCAYDASAIVAVFRPALAIVDQSLVENGEAGFLDALASDPRSPGVKVLLGVRRGKVVSHTGSKALAGAIEEPFSPDEIVALVEHCPIELMPAEERESRS